jgi:hypothetical protein
MYGGTPSPPGYPLWTIYAWPFALVPVSNIARRAGVATALAGALACGIIALLVSRGGAAMLASIPRFEHISPAERKRILLVCSCVAGLAFGFDGMFWQSGLIADAWTLSVLLFATTICLFTKWAAAPERRRYLYMGWFAYGLTLTNSQAFAVAFVGLQIFVLCNDAELGRDLLFATAGLSTALLIASHWKLVGPFDGYITPVRPLYWGVTVGSFLISLARAKSTRRLMTRWKVVLLCGLFLVLGLSLYFYLPVVSMSNPPMNGGYCRTVEGFFHTLTRGQFEHIFLTGSPGRFLKQIVMYSDHTIHEFGLIYIVAASVPFCFLHRMRRPERVWILGLTAVFLCLSLLMLLILNPPEDASFNPTLFSASHFILAVWSGLGFILAASFLANRSKIPR